jgi:energy-coupling factor transporter transmembrane protein EcfT
MVCGPPMGAYMYITVFDLLVKRFPRWRNISPANRAVIIGPLIVAVLLLLGGTAIATRYHYMPLMVLGLFCGAVVAKVLGKFLAPQIQSHLTVFLGGITTGNIGSSGAGLHKLITGIADQINKLVTLIPASAGDISAATTLGLWIALLTALVILGANAYYANQQSSPVGNRVERFAAGPAVPSAIGESAVQG